MIGLAERMLEADVVVVVRSGLADIALDGDHEEYSKLDYIAGYRLLDADLASFLDFGEG